eukprot:2697409-Alexandrium_andersonii.AAC.1
MVPRELAVARHTRIDKLLHVVRDDGGHPPSRQLGDRLLNLATEIRDPGGVDTLFGLNREPFTQ